MQLRRFFPNLELDLDTEHDALHTTAHLLVSALDAYSATTGSISGGQSGHDTAMKQQQRYRCAFCVWFCIVCVG